MKSPRTLQHLAAVIIQVNVFPGGSAIKNLPAAQETWVWSLGQEDLQKKKMATHSNILAWENSMDRGAWRLQSMGLQYELNTTAIEQQ